MINLKIDPKKRSKTLQISNNYPASLVSTPTNHRNKWPTEDQFLNYTKPQTPKPNSHLNNCPFENPNISSACDSPDQSSFKRMKMMIRAQLQKLSYREKLNNIQAILWRCKQLCHTYGYFILTCMMFEYHPQSQIKFGIWIHPDKRVEKPLHPIKKATEFESQLEFIANLRRILREMFPTIDLGKGKTFANLTYHIADLKKSLILKGKKSFGPVLTTDQIAESNMLNKSLAREKDPKKNLCTSLKAMPVIFPHFQSNASFCDDKRIDDKLEQKYLQKQNNFKIDKAQKATVSTLVQSIRSNSGIQQKMRKATLNLKDESEAPKKFSSFGPSSISILNKISSFNSRKNSIQPMIEILEKIEDPQPQSHTQNKPQSQPKPEQTCSKKSQIHTRRSRINGFMATSGEIESDLNNLFGAEDSGDAYYDGFGDGRQARNSVLSQVMQEFEQLLF